MTAFSFHNRSQITENLKSVHYDLIVIGGGITGAGILLDATNRGLKCCLIEKGDFASGTSSKSTKLIHGGLRYLKQLDFQLVAEVGKERKIVSVIANHLTYPERVLLPFIKDGSLKKWPTRLALNIYEFLSKVEKKDQFKMLDKQEASSLVPNLDQKGLLGGAEYVEYRTNDARLTLEVLKTAVQQKAPMLNYCKVENFSKNNDMIDGVYVYDQIGDEKFLIRGKTVVNATGPWVDQTRKINDANTETKLLHTKGVHLVFDKNDFPLSQAIYFDTADKRMVFAIPRGQKVYIGTTDTIYSESLDSPDITIKDKSYIINSINELFPDIRLQLNHIESGWSGVRPLIHQAGKGPSEVSRKDEIFEDSSGLISIAGGKLTGYRKMAEKIVDLINHRFNLSKPCTTDQLLVSGAVEGGLSGFQLFLEKKTPELVDLGLPKDIAIKLIRRYAKNIHQVIEIYDENEFNNSKLPLEVYLSLNYSLKHEMVLTLGDFFIRRTNALYFNIQLVNNHKEDVAQFMQTFFSWSNDKIEQELSDLMEEIKEAS